MPVPKGAMGSPYTSQPNEASIGEFMNDAMDRAMPYAEDANKPKKTEVTKESPTPIVISGDCGFNCSCNKKLLFSEELFREFLTMLITEKSIAIDSATKEKIEFTYKNTQKMVILPL